MSRPYALILAGGSGTRFWPLSRNAKPKQLLNLLGDETLLDQTLTRLEGLVPPENILILTNALQEESVRALASSLPPGNILAEPARRDTGPAVALGIGLVAARDPEATMMVLPADQLIRDTASYHSVMKDALAAASAGAGLVTVGVKPSWPCPSYGYVERGEPAALGELNLAHQPHEVVCFREKPAPEQAEKFLASGNFAWNAGMFIWSIPTVLSELHTHTPELANFVEEIRDTGEVAATVAARFPKLTPISIDYALMEKASRVLNIEATFDWDDVGSWTSVANYLEPVAGSNRSNTAVTIVESENNIIFSEEGRRIALLGVEDLIVVQTGDAILVANRHKADDIKKIVQDLPEDLL